MTTKLITSDQIIELAFTNKNTDVDLINDAVINAAQFAYIKPILGEEFYDDLLDAVENSTEDDNELILLNDHLRPALAYYIKGDIMPDLMANTTSAGIRVNSNDNSQPASDKQVTRVQDAAYKFAARLKDKMVDYLDDNDDLFTLWTCADNDTRDTFQRSGISLTKNPNGGSTVSNQTRGFIINDNLGCR